jgi:hypothetical protein
MCLLFPLAPSPDKRLRARGPMEVANSKNACRFDQRPRKRFQLNTLRFAALVRKLT